MKSSPLVMRKAVPLGTKLGSFASAVDSVASTLEIKLTTKRVERLTKRIGQERVAELELSIAGWKSLPLVEQLSAPKVIKSPAVASLADSTAFGQQLAAHAWSLWLSRARCGRSSSRTAVRPTGASGNATSNTWGSCRCWASFRH